MKPWSNKSHVCLLCGGSFAKIEIDKNYLCSICMSEPPQEVIKASKIYGAIAINRLRSFAFRAHTKVSLRWNDVVAFYHSTPHLCACCGLPKEMTSKHAQDLMIKKTPGYKKPKDYLYISELFLCVNNPCKRVDIWNIALICWACSAIKGMGLTISQVRMILNSNTAKRKEVI